MVRKIIISLMLLCGFFAAQGAAKRTAADSITADYKDWKVASLQGKAKLSGVPVKATVKAYMERNRSMLISLSAPFLGEVGRIEVIGDSLTLINKMKGVYCKSDLKALLHGVPLTLSEVQDMMLGRVFLVGYGTLSSKNSAMSEISDMDNSWLVEPVSQLSDLGVVYGFIVDKGLKSSVFLATDNGRFEADVEYTFKNNGKYDAAIEINSDRMNFSVDFEMDEPKWGVKSLSASSVNPNWQLVGIREFLKSF